jgi:hypothetical protein
VEPLKTPFSKGLFLYGGDLPGTQEAKKICKNPRKHKAFAKTGAHANGAPQVWNTPS